MVKVAVYGAGSWGTALAFVLAKAGRQVYLIGRNEEQVRKMRETRENRQYLPGINLPEEVEPTMSLEEIPFCEAVLLCVPSHAVRSSVRKIKALLPASCIIVNTAKGLEENSGLRLSQVIREELPTHAVAVLSGPSHAEEVGLEVPTAVVSAADDLSSAEKVQDLIMTQSFRVYTSLDLIGVEMGGALKNTIALCSGILEGMSSFDNTKAALITRGVAEIARLGVAMGADFATFSGLTGIGDLIVTCTSTHSRNLRAGRALGSGKPLEQVLEEIGMVVEGVRTTKTAYELSCRFGVSMPITKQAYMVLFEGLSPKEALTNLMLRSKKHETEDLFRLERTGK